MAVLDHNARKTLRIKYSYKLWNFTLWINLKAHKIVLGSP